MSKLKMAPLVLTFILAIGSTGVIALAEDIPEKSGGASRKHGKAAAYMAMSDEERAALKSKILENLTDEEKAALIEKIGGGKGGALGQNDKGGKTKAFQSMTPEEKAQLRSERRSNKTEGK